MKIQKVNAIIIPLVLILFGVQTGYGQGLTTAGISGSVKDEQGEPLVGANVVVVHEPTGTQYGTTVRSGGAYNIPYMRIGGPYTVTVSFIGYGSQEESDVYLNLGTDFRVNFRLAQEAIEMAELEVVAERDKVLNAGRTGAATFVDANQVASLPSIKRSTRDLTRLRTFQHEHDTELPPNIL
ncbi:MAG: carboxypeptidase regulatory-like domain-containing protein [Candidatus Marinimicrobia bacterium]|nr:carboxypeptidase regulatory-like domain-containing protein [Candidatus Neomarinimicrobiota bacterium]